MRLWSDLASRLRSVLSTVTGRGEDKELAEEIRFHIEKETEKNVAAGMSPEEARRLAHIKFGGVERMKERTREARGIGSVEDLARNLRYALRSLRSTRLLSLAAILTVSLGVAVTATTFSIVYGILVRPLPFPDAERLSAVELVPAEGAIGTPEFEALDLRDFRERQTSFESLDGYFQREVSLTDAQGFTRGLTATFVTASALDRLGVPAHLGRTFRPGEAFTPDIRHAVLGWDLWQERFGGVDNVIGRTLQVDGRTLEVVGIMPAGFSFPGGEELWLPMDFALPTTDRGSGRSFSVFGRLQEGVTMEAASAESGAIASRIASENPDYFPPLDARVFPLAERHLPGGIAPMLQVMLVAVFGVLFIACANVANLLLTRSLIRRQEVSVRRALGASRGHIVLQFLTESLLLSTAGCLLGLGLTTVGMAAVQRSLARLPLPEWVDVSVAGPALGLIAALIVVVALAAGALPAIQAAGIDAATTLGDRSRGALSPTLRGRGSILVTAQVALSCALLIGAGLVVRSLVEVRGMDTGYDASRVLVAGVQLPASSYGDPGARSVAFAEILQRVRAIPGANAASIARNAPGTGPTFSWTFEVRGEVYEAGEYPEADGVPVAHDYFEVMGIELAQGRDFTSDESRFGTAPALIVNETLARRHLGPDPVGRQIRIGGGDGGEPWLTVVGVVEDTHVGSSSGGIGMDGSPREQAYLSWGVAPYSAGALLVASDGDPTTLAPRIRNVLRETAPTAAVYSTARLSDVIDDSTWAFGLFGTVFGVFGVLALILSAVGLYGVMAFSVDQRRPEMSLRMAMGADGGRILRMVLVEAGRHLALGVTLGVVLGMVLARGIQAVLFGVGPMDPTVYGIVLATVVGTAIVAVLVPASQAARAEPAASLGG